MLGVLGMWFAQPHASTPVAFVPPADWVPYSNTDFGFDLRLPPGYTTDDEYFYGALGPGKEVPGIKFMVPKVLTEGTNLSADSGISIEELARAACTPADFLDTTVSASSTTVTLGGDEYTTATAGGAGAGNFYEETVYVRKDRATCVAIRFFIHSTNIHNYDPGTVTEFDRAGLMSTFTDIAKTIRFI